MAITSTQTPLGRLRHVVTDDEYNEASNNAPFCITTDPGQVPLIQSLPQQTPIAAVHVLLEMIHEKTSPQHILLPVKLTVVTSPYKAMKLFPTLHLFVVDMITFFKQDYLTVIAKHGAKRKQLNKRGAIFAPFSNKLIAFALNTTPPLQKPLTQQIKSKKS